MSFLTFLPIIEKVFDRVFPDKVKRDEAKLKLLEMQQAGDLKELDALIASDKNQSDVNLEEAKSESLFKSGWRPGIGWLCVMGFGYTVFRPLLIWVSGIFELGAIPPPLDTAEILQILLGMLGLGAYRSFEKKHGVNK